MRVLLVVLIGAIGAATVLPDDAMARTRGARAKASKQQTRFQPRHASVGPNGLCQRDTGTPISRLDFRRRCDLAEFWERTQHQD